ncbi:hypothetical protein BDV23DRAFT_156941 [Aspergillus alliaceus]|uniref:Uncharacterized protein n=1 Tax=Petromyces alliaceus TaxID=209559 RepID=A0A5N7C6B1_PETAA|nr:hypothetical protein BDV23DRAFT_156941 [Aspergillus alliaceus]
MSIWTAIGGRRCQGLSFPGLGAETPVLRLYDRLRITAFKTLGVSTTYVMISSMVW